MCGIAGILNLNTGQEVTPDLLQGMIAAVHHRGPDESGIYVDDSIGLAHARLSIIDLSAGPQPICNESKSLWIIYNGEVYNYTELREWLVQKGHRFKTRTDTEVILHLFEEKGADCLASLNGQFAFAIWDARKKELFLARDRVGIRPLFYSQWNGQFIFASEMKSIMQVPGFPREINPHAINQIFTFWTTLPGDTPFKNIESLNPGQFMTVSAKGTHIQTWWEPPFVQASECSTEPLSTLIEKADDLLSNAVKIRLKADVPVGTYLSGGLDSSSILYKVQQNEHASLKTFGIRFDHKDYDEGSYQQTVARQLNTDHHEIMVSNEMVASSLWDTIYHCEMPLLRTSPVPLYLLSDLVFQNGMKVVMTGEGADEIFGGYHIFRENKVRRFWSRQPESSWRPLLIQKLYPYIFKHSRPGMFTAFFGQHLLNTEDPFYSHAIRWNNAQKNRQFLSPDQRALKTDDQMDQLEQLLPASFNKWDALSKAQWLEITLFMSNYLLSSQGDRMAMAHSVEIRLPFLDHRLVEFACQLPAQWKIRGLKEKYLLKKMMATKLPDTVARRTKQPYRAPISRELITDERHQTLLSEEYLKNTQLFDGKKVALLQKKVRSRENITEIDGMALTGILTAQILHHQFIENRPVISQKGNRADFIIDRRKIA